MEAMKAKRPSVFVGSSVEGLEVAYAVQENLDHDAEVTVWSQGIFEPSRTTLETLEKQLSRFDFAIFVFSPDDLLQIRGKEFSAVRDNVIFELGLATGKLGRDRSYILMPRTAAEIRLPTDLLGITPFTFNPSRSDKNIVAALGPACSQLNRLMKKTILGDGISKHRDTESAHSPRDGSSVKSGVSDAEGSGMASLSRKNDAITRFAVEIVNKAEAKLDPELRPQGHSRWAGVFGAARYYRLWYQRKPWHRDQFRYQLWLESSPEKPRTLWVGFSVKLNWLNESGYHRQKSVEILNMMNAYAEQKKISVLQDGEFLGINYEMPALDLSKPLIDLASIRLFTLINTLTPLIDEIFPSGS